MIFRIVEITMELEIFKKAIEVEERTLGKVSLEFC